jgi:hypothetical protein
MRLSLVGLLALGAAGCSSEDASPRDPVDELRARLDGQAIVIVPFDLDDPDCQTDPEEMAEPVLAKCAWLGDAHSGYTITSDPRTFDPAPSRQMMLVVYGATIDPARSGWVGIVGLGPLPSGDGSLVHASGIRPAAIPLIIGAAYLLQAAVAVGIAYYGAKAIVATTQVMNQQLAAPAVQRTQQAVERQTKLINCTPDEHELLKGEKAQACDDLPQDCAKADPRVSSYCLDLSLRRGEYEKCRAARQNVTDKCFGGVNDKVHQAQIDNMTKAMSGCDALLASACR